MCKDISGFENFQAIKQLQVAYLEFHKWGISCLPLMLPHRGPVAYLGVGHWAMTPFGKKNFTIGKNRKLFVGPFLCEH